MVVIIYRVVWNPTKTLIATEIFVNSDIKCLFLGVAHGTSMAGAKTAPIVVPEVIMKILTHRPAGQALAPTLVAADQIPPSKWCR